MNRTILKDHLFWCYANLAMAHAAIGEKKRPVKYKRVHYMIRAKLFKGLMNSSMSIRSLFDDEREKVVCSGICYYCGMKTNLSFDHLIPKSKGGLDSGDNLVYSCQRCNSSKGNKDFLQWCKDQQCFPPLMVLRRYLKLLYLFALENELLEQDWKSLGVNVIPFRVDLLPILFPMPNKIALYRLVSYAS